MRKIGIHRCLRLSFRFKKVLKIEKSSVKTSGGSFFLKKKQLNKNSIAF